MSNDPTIPLPAKPDTSIMPGLHSLRSEIEELSRQHRRNVTVTFDHRSGNWIAGMGGIMTSSIVGPSNALEQLAEKLEDVDVEPVTDTYELKIQDHLDEVYDPNRGKPGLGWVLMTFVLLGVFGWLAFTLLRMANN